MKNQELISVLLQADPDLEVQVMGHGWVTLEEGGLISVREGWRVSGVVVNSETGRLLLVADVVADA